MLLESPGWARLVEIATAQINHRRGQHTLAPLQDASKIGVQQFELGEAAGIDLFVNLPKSLIASHDAAMQSRRAAERESEDEQGDA